MRRWGRRHQALVGAAAVGLLLAASAVGGSVAWVVRDASARKERVERAVSVPLDAAERLQEQERWPDALTAARQAQGLLATGAVEALLRRRVEQTLSGLELRADLEEVRLDFADHSTDEGYDYDRASAAFDRVLRRAGIDLGAQKPTEAADRIPAAVRVPVAGQLDAWAARNRGLAARRIRAVAQAADPDEWRGRLREAEATCDRQALTELAKDRRLEDMPAATMFRLGDGLRMAGAPEDAVALLRKAQQRYPNDFWINHELALDLANLNPPRTEDAVRFFTAAAALRPQSPGARNNLGQALSKMGSTDEAIAAYREAIRLKPDYADAIHSLGRLQSRKGDVDKAIAAYRSVIRLKPGDASVHYNLGNELGKKGDPEAAIAAYREAIRLEPDNAHAHVNLGVVLHKQGNLDKAIASFKKAIRLNPNDFKAHNNLGSALYDKADNDGAIAAFREVLRLRPGSGIAQFNLGNALYVKGDRDAAVAAYRRAIRIDPSYPNPHARLGTILHDLGKFDEAIASYREATRLKADDANSHNDLAWLLANCTDARLLRPPGGGRTRPQGGRV